MTNRETDISHLERRKIEGRVLIPLLQELAARLGESAMLEVLGATIDRLAAEDGAAWAKIHGQTTASGYFMLYALASILFFASSLAILPMQLKKPEPIQSE